MASPDAIASAISAILAREGGYVDNPADPGGRTNFGITQDTADMLGLGDVSRLDMTTARFAYSGLFGAWHITQIPDDPTFELVADCCVNHGPTLAIRWLQNALGCIADGTIGPQTVGAMGTASWPHVYSYILSARIRLYGRIVTDNPAELQFLNGWLARALGFINPIPTWPTT
jgi:lysozyme family protein